MQGVPCPSCGAAVQFRSPALPYVVCAYCQSMVMRDDDGIRDMGKTAVLPFDISPIQLGTLGTADNIAFEVIGRVRWGWTDGAWNEWLLMGIDGQHRWLGEAMGQFMLLEERPIESTRADSVRAIVDSKNITIGQHATMDRIDYVTSDIRDVTCLGSEGELPFRTSVSWTATSVDFRNNAGHCATIQRDQDGTSLYVGRYVELMDLKPHHLRVIDGWAAPTAAIGVQ
jgi:endogenous inhibitor of DNA gyrase (YacG/DUF329 family)